MERRCGCWDGDLGQKAVVPQGSPVLGTLVCWHSDALGPGVADLLFAQGFKVLDTSFVEKQVKKGVTAASGSQAFSI